MFPLFAKLPTEVQLEVWNAINHRPGVQIFDVCFPASDPSDNSRASAAFKNRHRNKAIKDESKRCKEKVFIDSLELAPRESDGASTVDFRRDPSTYKLSQTLLKTCINSANAVRKHKTSSIFLPAKGMAVPFDDNIDLFCLRFISPSVDQDGTHRSILGEADGQPSNNIRYALECLWSDDMALALRSARRIAIDISELWGQEAIHPHIIQEIAALCSCIQSDLEALYLIDYCIGRCRRCWKGGLNSAKLTERMCVLSESLDPLKKEMDHFYGSGVVYREICDLEGLGWTPDQLEFQLAIMMGDIIREQQGPEGAFRSVRILACENEPGNDDAVVLQRCSSTKAETVRVDTDRGNCEDWLHFSDLAVVEAKS
ncbi:hypothetical protein NQ176_g4047 [Zarea fungicola]|uniref:Uncharacterized protein n=1 Tax=Zarea fungicola TaxID=93591 RepID=A0ACC1NFB4_9HYPO|nr:hypothetical protein NQ176_g4047 [Lecanicillium fungicola]